MNRKEERQIDRILKAVDDHNRAVVANDERRLDFLQAMLDQRKYTGKAALRWSSTGRGLRLHETSDKGASDSVRQAIDDFMREENWRPSEND